MLWCIVWFRKTAHSYTPSPNIWICIHKYDYIWIILRKTEIYLLRFIFSYKLIIFFCAIKWAITYKKCIPHIQTRTSNNSQIILFFIAYQKILNLIHFGRFCLFSIRIVFICYVSSCVVSFWYISFRFVSFRVILFRFAFYGYIWAPVIGCVQSVLKKLLKDTVTYNIS